MPTSTPRRLRLAFLGSAGFSIPTLRACASAHDVAVVVTAPAGLGNRGRPAPRPVADAAVELHLPLLQPQRLRRDATDALLALHLDALVVFAYGQILPGRLLDGVRHGGVNVHPSLLPRWRGASPIASAIRAGDAETGVCILRMDAGMDTGPVYARRVVPMPPRATTPALSIQLAAIGAEMAMAVLEDLASGRAVAVPQEETGATHAPLLRRVDGRIEWADMDAVDIDRHVRAMQPWPGTMAAVGDEDVRILSGEVVACEPAPTGLPEPSPGTVVRSERDGLVVATRDGAFRVSALQPPGRRPMDAAAYWRGRRITAT